MLCNDWRAALLLHYETDVRLSAGEIQAAREVRLPSQRQIRLGHFPAGLCGWWLHQLLVDPGRCLPSHRRVDTVTGVVLHHDHPAHHWLW